MTKRKHPSDILPTGRPTKYLPEYDDLVYKFCLLGATDAQLAVNLEVTEATLNNWKIDHPSFFESIRAGRAIADAEIAKSLYHVAKGYEHPEDKIFNDNGSPMIVPTIRHYPPDSRAASLWLRNRQPQLWRDKQEIEHSGGFTVTETRKRLEEETKGMSPAEKVQHLESQIAQIKRQQGGGS